MKLLVLDFEVFQYDWHVTVKDYLTREKVLSIWNDPEALRRFYEQNKNELFMGYNIKGYDQYILKGILCGMEPKPINDWIIVQRQDGWRYSDAFRKIPLNFYEIQKKRDKSLKELEGALGLSIKESEVDFRITRPLTPEERAQTEVYCEHDVDAACEVLNATWNEFRALLSMCKTFKRPLRDMCKTKAQLVSKILGAVKKDLNDEFKFRLPETLKLDKYQVVADWFMDSVERVNRMMEERGLDPNDPEKFREVFYDGQGKYKHHLEIDVAGVKVKFKLGGGHGGKKGFRYKCKPGYILILFDVNQLYPVLMIAYELISRAVTNPELFKEILNTSLRLKAEGKSEERTPFKEACNSIYGVSGAPSSNMYDPLHRNLVCIYGQLLLLMLIEELEDISELVQFNTDGIISVVKLDDLGEFKARIHDWEERTHLQMSFTECEEIIESNVNNYILIQKNGKKKYVGGRVKERVDLDNNLSIVRDALVRYLEDGTPPEETIYGCDELIKFQNVVKYGKTFDHATHNGKKYTEKCFRIFASKDENDGKLEKVKINEDGTLGTTKMSPEHAFIYNDDVRDMKCPDKLDKDYYVALAYDWYDQFMKGDDE